MRTTLTLEDDVVAMLKRAEAKTSLGFKDLVNSLLRCALTETLAKPKPAQPRYNQPSSDTGRCRFDNVDDVESVLDEIEGPMRR